MSVGLDIGSKTIKMVELAKEGGKWKLRSSGIVGYSGNPIEHMQDEKELTALSGLIQLMRQLFNIKCWKEEKVLLLRKF
jgi:Tfp pilus assembly PilM family ATPase